VDARVVDAERPVVVIGSSEDEASLDAGEVEGGVEESGGVAFDGEEGQRSFARAGVVAFEDAFDVEVAEGCADLMPFDVLGGDGEAEAVVVEAFECECADGGVDAGGDADELIGADVVACPPGVVPSDVVAVVLAEPDPLRQSSPAGRGIQDMATQKRNAAARVSRRATMRVRGRRQRGVGAGRVVSGRRGSKGRPHSGQRCVRSSSCPASGVGATPVSS
jgi:hypothetical protein